ncbi:hypothetical protein CSOJ01_06777 [Colletotrichum sojae]|uniref:AB hydrolase-1 domain-containing protein n=1 Tax=Colletotrichum sojae TaxID=2175907 RepID=A0A8H6JB52_9PEZI|nr:hypothetical protein CSOJ01_06777 [Colletotrichum sojae]
MAATKAPRSLGIVLIHGGFHQSTCFALAKSRLEAAGFSPVLGVDLTSVGTNPSVTLDDDARSIQAAIEPHIDAGREFLALAHSYGAGKKGGIRAAIYLTANMPPKKGASALSVLPPGLDIVDVGDDGLVRANAKAKAAFYGPDMSDETADACMAALLPQSSAALFGGASVGLDELTVPAYYILCEKDQTIAPATQQEIIATIPTLRRVLRNPGGHSAFITEVDRFVEQVVEIAEEVEREGEVEA